MRRSQGIYKLLFRKIPFWRSQGTSALFTLLFLGLFTGCSYQHKNVLFKTKTKIETGGVPIYRLNVAAPPKDSIYQHIIQPDDRIAVRFLNNYDISTGVSMSAGTENGNEWGFLVGTDGTVRLPLLGSVNLQGYNRLSASNYLEKLYKPHFRNPNIEVSVLNISVSVMGEVTRPGLYVLEKERTNLLEVLSMASGISQFGKLNQIKVIRGDLTDPEIIIFDLKQIEAISTNDLIIHNNDIIYVEPKRVKLFRDNVLPYTTLISAFSALALLVITILQRTQ